MKYSEKLVWEAVGDICPGLLEAKEKGFYVTLPECLKIAAVEVFLDEGGIANAPNRRFAAHVIKVALKELKTIGWMTFGTVEQYW